MEFAWQVQAIEADVPAVVEDEADTLPGVVRRHARLSPNAPALIEWKPGRRLTTSYSTLVRSLVSLRERGIWATILMHSVPAPGHRLRPLTPPPPTNQYAGVMDDPAGSQPAIPSGGRGALRHLEPQQPRVSRTLARSDGASAVEDVAPGPHFQQRPCLLFAPGLTPR